MKKYIPYVIITVLLMVIASGATYIILDNKDNKDTTTETNKENNSSNSNVNNEIENNDNNQENDDNNNEVSVTDGVKLVSIKEENDKIVQEFKVTLNGKEQTLKVGFEYEYDESRKLQDIYGTFNNITFVSRGYYNTENLFNVNNIKEFFYEDNFQIIKGTDNKNYLLVISNGDYENLIYVFNDKLELLTKNLTNRYFDGYRDGFVITSWSYNVETVENKENPGYEDSFNLDKNYEPATIYVRIENNKIYYLVTILDDYNNENDGILEERIYTINNDKLEYEVINTYKVTEIGNMI